MLLLFTGFIQCIVHLTHHPWAVDSNWRWKLFFPKFCLQRDEVDNVGLRKYTTDNFLTKHMKRNIRLPTRSSVNIFYVQCTQNDDENEYCLHFEQGTNVLNSGGTLCLKTDWFDSYSGNFFTECYLIMSGNKWTTKIPLSMLLSLTKVIDLTATWLPRLNDYDALWW